MHGSRLVAAAVAALVLCQPAAALQDRAGDVLLAGWLQMIWADAANQSASPARLLLVDGRGRATALDVPPALLARHGGPLALNRRRVEATGRWKDAAQTTLAVTSIEPELVKPGAAAPGRSAGVERSAGPQKYVTILCRFADMTGVTPNTLQHMSALMTGGQNPQMDHYWREQSFDTINVQGSVVVGWFNLPQPKSYYVYDMNGDGAVDADLGRLVTDATAVADAAVHFPDYVGINLCFNSDLDCCAWGGGYCLTLDGVSRCWNVTWLPTWGYQNQSVIGHEMGHSLGFPHSSGPYAQTYDSKWDVMSNSYISPVHPTYGFIGQHTISYHKSLGGWIPSGRKYYALPGTANTIALERLGQPIATNNYLMAQIPIDDAGTLFYTVEARNTAGGYDGPIPASAVVIHRVNTQDLTGSAARVVDADNNGDPNDAGAMWLPGETFSDAANGVTVEVLSGGGSSYTVRITRAAVGAPCQAQVPADRWKSELFTNASLSGAPVVVRDEGAGFLSFDWGAGSPYAFCNSAFDGFSNRWTRTVRLSAGTYRFYFGSDDGFRMFLDNTQIIDHWLDGGWGWIWETTLAEGDHTIRLEHYDNTGHSSFDFRWERVVGDCAYGMSPSSAAFPAAGGAGSADVTSASGCSWTAASNAPWITVTSGPGGNGNGTVAYTVAPNLTGAERTGTMAIAGQTFVVKQQGGGSAAGLDTAGVYVGSTGSYFLRNANTSGPADVVFGFGPAGAGWTPLRGDWDGDGDDTAGLYDPANGVFFLKNSNAAGGADLVFGFGPAGAGWTPVAGDWDGDGDDTIGLYDPATSNFFLKNSNAAGGADVVFGFGPAGAGWTPAAGDWNGDGADTIGLYNPANGFFFLRNALAPGGADLVFGFGAGGAGVRPLAGDWNGDGADTIGIYISNTGFFFLRNSNASGGADLVFGYGPANVVPLLGDWDGL